MTHAADFLPNWLEKGKGGFTVEQLKVAFDKVCNSEDWKMPVDALIDLEEIEITRYAIAWYTGSEAVFSPGPDGLTRVTAPGYYLTCD